MVIRLHSWRFVDRKYLQPQHGHGHHIASGSAGRKTPGAGAHRACGDPRPAGPFLLHTALGSKALLSLVCVSLHAVGPAGPLTYRIYGCRGADLPRGDRESVLDGSITRPAHASKYLGTYIPMAGRGGVGFRGHGHAVAVSGLESVISCGNSLRARAHQCVWLRCCQHRCIRRQAARQGVVLLVV